ncbi:MAG: GatB/YqeY domain-containing protein [Candidatus Eisenbacteria bacterium]|uniref:GatB/YqeY domain-containing protein n=1 Tax=Eiseniibacteriota bacterium TaxID=2212470 RepID=A0A849SJT9_UNCEI|nr:GatB/YqeY domain-containing protein [Candidatus Eisenbacteria bacterium]
MSDPTILERLQADMTAAMKAKDADTLGTLRMLKSALMEAKTRKPKDATLSADEEIEVLQRYAKKRREAIEELKKLGRDDLAAREEVEIVVTTRYLPLAISEDELRAIVKAAVVSTGALSPREMGKVVSAVMPQVRGRTEGGTVARLVKEALGG